MSILKFKKPDGTWESIAAIKGEPGKDGAIQYKAGDGIKIENDTITAEVDKQYVDEAIAGIDIPESDSKLAVNFVELSGGRWVPMSETGYDYDWRPIQQHNYTSLDNAIKNTKYNSDIFIKILFASEEILFHSKLPLRTTWTSYQMTGIGANQYGTLRFFQFSIQVSWDGETPTVTSASNLKRYDITGVKPQNVLVKANTTEFTPTSDYHPATKKYVDDSIADIDVGGPKYVYEFDLKREGRPLNTTIILNDDEKERLRLLFNQILADGTVNTHVILLHNSLWDGRLIYLTPFYNSHLDDISASDYYQYLKYNGVFIDNATANDFGYEQFQLEVNYKSSTGESIDSMSTCKINWDYGYIIGTNNKYAFTPTSDYHPATKKYVDDAVAGIEAPTDGGDIGMNIFNYCYRWNQTSDPQYADSGKSFTDLINNSYGNIGGTNLSNIITQIRKDLFYDGKSSRINFILYYNGTASDRDKYYVIPFEVDTITKWANSFDNTYTFKSLFYMNGKQAYASLVVNGTWEEEIFTFSSATLYLKTNYLLTNDAVLTKTNTTEFTPTSNYHPATKKYVDDAIANIDIPEGGGDVTNLSGHYYLKIKPYVTAPGAQYPDYGTALSPGTAQFNLEYTEGYQEMLASIFDDVVNGIQPILHLLVANEQGAESNYLHQFLAMELDGTYPNSTEGESLTLKFRHTLARDGKIYRHSIEFPGKITDGKFTMPNRWANYECVIDTYVLKTYVDNAIAAAITTVLEAEY